MSYDPLAHFGYTHNELESGILSIIDGRDHYTESKFISIDNYQNKDNITLTMQSLENADTKTLINTLDNPDFQNKLLNFLANNDTDFDVFNQSRNIQRLITNNPTEFKNIAIDFIINSCLKIMIKRYQKIEKTPKEYLDIIHFENFIYISLRNLFIQKYNLTLTENLNKSILSIEFKVKENIHNDIVYDRVSQIQNFIHNTIIKNFGVNSHYKLDIQTMKGLLSSLRLYLNVNDLKKLHLSRIIDIHNKTNERISNEIKNPSKSFILPGKKFIPHWKIFKMKSLIGFIPNIFNDDFRSLLLKNEDMSINDILLKMIYIKYKIDESIQHKG